MDLTIIAHGQIIRVLLTYEKIIVDCLTNSKRNETRTTQVKILCAKKFFFMNPMMININLLLMFWLEKLIYDLDNISMLELNWIAAPKVSFFHTIFKS